MLITIQKLLLAFISLALVSSCQLSYRYEARQEVLCPINLGITLNANAQRLNPLDFSPADQATYTDVVAITVNDLAGIQRLVSLYFVAVDDDELRWYVYLSVDGEQLDIINGQLAADDYRAGQLIFNAQAQLSQLLPDRFRSPFIIFDDDQYEHQFVITIDPITSELGNTFAASISVPGCSLR